MLNFSFEFEYHFNKHFWLFSMHITCSVTPGWRGISYVRHLSLNTGSSCSSWARSRTPFWPETIDVKFNMFTSAYWTVPISFCFCWLSDKFFLQARSKQKGEITLTRYLCVEADIARGETHYYTCPVRPPCGASTHTQTNTHIYIYIYYAIYTHTHTQAGILHRHLLYFFYE